MTTQQLYWARCHDWFLFARQLAPHHHIIYVTDETSANGMKGFADFRMLSAWAGY